MATRVFSEVELAQLRGFPEITRQPLDYRILSHTMALCSIRSDEQLESGDSDPGRDHARGN